MSLRIAVYAEGSRDAGRALSLPLGDELADTELGPVHVLIRRCLAGALPEGAIRFARPQRTRNGRVARGSDLLDRTTLRQLLSWPPQRRAPQLAVVVIDADGELARADLLRGYVDGLPSRSVLGLAVQEFEAWLASDDAAVAKALGVHFPTLPSPEGMKRSEAKGLLLDAIGRANRDAHLARLTIAETCALDLVASRCPSFARFRADLAEAARK